MVLPAFSPDLVTQAAKLGLNENDLAYLVDEQGLKPEDIAAQLRLLNRDALCVTLQRPCTAGDGILRLDPARRERLAQIYREWRQVGKPCRFVPASGAASRLFAALDWCRSQKPTLSWDALQFKAAEAPKSEAAACLHILQAMDRMPFAAALRQSLKAGDAPWEVVYRSLGPGAVADALLSSPGLNLSVLPKALIPFHRTKDGIRTALDAQLLETTSLAADGEGLCRIHFTVSPEHRELFEAACQAFASQASLGKLKVQATFSEQGRETRTLSLVDGQVQRDDAGKPALRPGGHGSLLANLEATEGELLFVKNIDNVCRPEDLPVSDAWHAALAGLLLEVRETLHVHLLHLDMLADAEKVHAAESAMDMLCREFSWSLPSAWAQASDVEKVALAYQALNRPIRVCGMVKNQGEPGGGPYFAGSSVHQGAATPQIVEAAQVQLGDAGQKQLFAQATHFNPVDFVCILHNHKGEKHRLADFADTDAWFLAKKPKGASWVTALERPGLWNGAMAGWLTLFVEIPVELFNPVKTIADLLRPAHQGRH